MSFPYWGWVAAKAVGTSHIRAGKGCDDFGGCVVVKHGNIETLIVVVSDGAGSAQHSAIGSRLVSLHFARAAAHFVKSGSSIGSITDRVALSWLDEIRDRISHAAKKQEATPRDYAATLVGCLISPTEAKFIHIGDGAAVYRLEESEKWEVGSWPTQGEYASTTYFVTDDPEPNLKISHVPGKISDVAIFSDGMERLVLDFSSNTPFAPFFEKVFIPIRPGTQQRDRALSRHLNSLLESPSVCDRTDDDKTIFLARRS